MAGQEQQRPTRRDSSDAEDVEAEPLPRASAATTGTEDDVDALLDEIDDVLEANAEQFVRQYTQKGGQ